MIYPIINLERVLFPNEDDIIILEVKEDFETISSHLTESKFVAVVNSGLPILEGTIVTIAEVIQLVDFSENNYRMIINGKFKGKISGEIKKISSMINIAPIEKLEFAPISDELKIVFGRKLTEKYNDLGSYSNNIDKSESLPVDLEDKIYRIISELDDINGTNFYYIEELDKLAHDLLSVLDIEIEYAKINAKVEMLTKQSIDRNQKEFYIREQIRFLNKEIGIDDDDSVEYELKLEALKMPEEMKQKLAKDVQKLDRLAIGSPELAILKSYLDLVLDLPWGKKTKDNKSLKDAEKILNEDHYGLEKVKERLIEALAVRQLSKENKSPIICLVGAPGIGKTSIAQSIARAMNRKYVRVSLGGIRDEAEIRGHRKTYVGAMPGRIINGILQAKSSNPVFLLDEIDKMSSDIKGDPSSALLEVLDPEQNFNFRDHYLELPFSLKDVLFITTANSLDTISRPLLDRMEIINMSGYTLLEKTEIAKRYLIPKALKANGITTDLVFSTEAIHYIIANYTRESGVRGLEKTLNKIMRKIATQIVKKEKDIITKMEVEDIPKYLRTPPYPESAIDLKDKIGVCRGLAWTEVGGEILCIEVSHSIGKGELIITGNLGDVMKESCRIALSYARVKASLFDIPANFFKENDIHIHVPEGATPKDGPSAGITILTAIISALTDKPVRGCIAMTGELSLKGDVLPIGGLKEKTLAALRAGIKTIFISKDNQPQYEELPTEVKDSISFVTVNNVEEVLKGAIISGD